MGQRRARADITESPAGITIEIGPARRFGLAPATAVAAALWAFAGYRALALFADACAIGGPERLATGVLAAASLAAWSGAGYLLTRELVFRAFATETVSVGAGLLRLRREGPIFRMAQEFELGAVRDLHLDPRAGRIRFHARRRHWSFGHALLREEAEQVLDRIRTRFGAIVRASA